MRLTHYGKDVLIKVFAFCIILNIVSVFIHILSIKFFLAGISVFLGLFTLYFFRDPGRKLPPDYSENQIISPADGKIVVIEDVVNKEKNVFAKDEPLKQISIFLSPLDVHVNRIPLSGEVKFLKYIKGDYLVAFNHKASEKNERSEIGIENGSSHKVLFKQIAGFVARRIVYDVKVGSSVTAGEKFGMIKFGSRVDILLKRESKIFVTMNQMVVGGETIIGEF